MTDMKVTGRDGVTVIALAGELTNPGIPDIERGFVMTTSAADKVVVDLSAVTMVTTPGISLIIAANKHLRMRGGKMVACGLSPNIKEVMLDRCRLDVVLQIAETQDDAMTQMAS